MVEGQHIEVTDRRVRPVDPCFERLKKALTDLRQYTELALGRLDTRMARVERQIGEEVVPAIANLEVGMGRIERKLDSFTEVQTKTNELVERRLQSLEARDQQ